MINIKDETFFNMEKLPKSDLLLLLEEEKCFYKGTLVEAKTSIAKTICQNTFQKHFNESNANDYFNTIGYKKDLLLVFQKAHQLL